MPRYDWEKIKIEYITTDMSLKQIAEKHGVAPRLVYEKSRANGWVAAKKKHNEKVAKKALNKVVTKQANALAKELEIANKISDVLAKALNDAEQFNRYIIDTTTKVDGTEVRTSEEKKFEKVDMKALKDAASALEMIERMKRSMDNIRKPEQINREKREQKRLELEEEKLQLQKEQMDVSKPDKDIHVIITGFEEGWDE